jgi:hypothetical protein
MVRRYAQPVDVVRRDDLPAQFRWRGRWYDVAAVLAHWFEAGGWWRSAAATAVFGVGPDSPDARPAGEDLVVHAVGAAAVDDGERELWRVEAAAGGCGAGVFDLSFDWSAGGWTVARVLD